MNPACLSPDLERRSDDGVGTVEVTSRFDEWQAARPRRHRPFIFEPDRAM
jgi:hypothetical protein